MAGRVEGKVAFITGAGRGQGRSHAIRLAEEGADIIAIDVPRPYDTLPYALATTEDLAETVSLVEALGRRIVAAEADVRDLDAMRTSLSQAVLQLGRLDIVCANAAICTMQAWSDVDSHIWQDTIDTNLTGVWNTLCISIPHLIANGRGSMIATSSTGGIKAQPFLGPYAASKHGIVGICRSLANELAIENIRVNTVHPTGVFTPMMQAMVDTGTLGDLISKNPGTEGIFQNALPVAAVEPRDVSEAVLFLASDESRYITGLELTVDAGYTIR
jgi:SDR family mycofactocin-dependent oxidoreductase